MELKNLEKLYLHELKDLYSVESQIIESLPKMIEKATDNDLKESLEEHLSETKEQKARIENIFKNYDHKPSGHKCKGIEGILAEADEVLAEVTDAESCDVAIISMCNRVEHYEIAGYGTARAMAEQMSKYDEADLLLKTLVEESAADHRLSTLAWRKVNLSAREDLKNAA